MVGGMVMLGGIITNKPPVNLSQVTPIARLTSEYDVFVVPANSPLKTMNDLLKAAQGEPGQRQVGRRLARRHRAHPGRPDRAGKSASTRRRSTTSPFRAAARRRRRSSAAT